MVLSAERILARCDALAAFSETPGALTRVFVSREHRQAAECVLGWMREAGMAAHMDAIGNVVGRYEGRTPGLPALVIGSTGDTVTPEPGCKAIAAAFPKGRGFVSTTSAGSSRPWPPSPQRFLPVWCGFVTAGRGPTD